MDSDATNSTVASNSATVTGQQGAGSIRKRGRPKGSGKNHSKSRNGNEMSGNERQISPSQNDVRLSFVFFTIF